MTISWIALNSVKGLGPVRIKQLIEKFGTPEAVFKEKPRAFAGIIPEMCISGLSDPQLFEQAEEQIRKAGKIGAEILTLEDMRYPMYLKEIFAPPPVLFVRGSLSAFTKHAVAVVGTRNPTLYGKTATTAITADLVGANTAIISGLARGIDTYAHEVCVANGGSTIAVLGSGIDTIYPSSNGQLAEKLQEKGALVSEFPLGTPPDAFNFPRRNRIISGLSAGVLVIEAGEKSGSLITAHYALQQGRDLFAVPGPITSQMSRGTFNLIKQGAVPVRCGNDIIEAIQVISSSQVMDFSTSCPVPKLPLDLLSQEETSILAFLGSEPSRIDAISEKTGQPVNTLFGILLNLELKGLIRQVSGQQYVRV